MPRSLAYQLVLAATFGVLPIAGSQGIADDAVPPPAGEAAPPVRVVYVFRDGEYGAHPHYGMPDEPGKGYAHYDLPSEHYGHWYRPKVFGLGPTERCAPRPFRPRGLGNLGNKPSTCHRIDYHPFVLENSQNRFGPSYFGRQPDPTCVWVRRAAVDR